uniref:PNT domain-containing protein n=1 Tax=Ciona savignyi TaxID=51511 RepID=H2YIJ4_CIOSA
MIATFEMNSCQPEYLSNFVEPTTEQYSPNNAYFDETDAVQSNFLGQQNKFSQVPAWENWKKTTAKEIARSDPHYRHGLRHQVAIENHHRRLNRRSRDQRNFNNQVLGYTTAATSFPRGYPVSPFPTAIPTSFPATSSNMDVMDISPHVTSQHMDPTESHYLGLDLTTNSNMLAAEMHTTASTSQKTRNADDVIMSTSGMDYPPNIAISPGSCKSPFCCTSPGFCNFPYHNHTFSLTYFIHRNNQLATQCDAPRNEISSPIHHDPVNRTQSDPFQQELVFVRDSAQEIDTTPSFTRRMSAPVVHDPFPIIKPDQISLPGLGENDDFSDVIAPMASLSSPSTSSLSSSTSSILNDNLLADVTGTDVIGLLSSPKLEILEHSGAMDFYPTEAIPPTKKTFAGAGPVRRSPPPPNITLNPENHKRSSLPQDPSTWTRNHVKEWLVSATKEYNFQDLDLKKFVSTDGYKLCQMTMRDLCRVTSKANAEVILNKLSVLKQSNSASPNGVMDPFQAAQARMPHVKDPYKLFAPICLELSNPGSSQIQLWQ